MIYFFQNPGGGRPADNGGASGHTSGRDPVFEQAERTTLLPLYALLRQALRARCNPVEIRVQRTQISFYNRRLFGAVSFLPARRGLGRRTPYFTVTFGLGYRLDSPRVDAAVEAYPRRWTHHVVVTEAAQIDGELLLWLAEAAAFSAAKR